MEAILNGSKPFEIRRNDRDFQVGDVLMLEEHTPENGYTGRDVSATVTYMTNFEQKENFVVMGIKLNFLRE